MRDIDDGLYRLFEFQRAHFIEQQRQQNRRRKAPGDAQKRKHHRIAEYARKLAGRKQIYKILHANPIAARNAPHQIEILESNHNAVHGPIAKNRQIHKAGNQHQIQPWMFADIDPRLFPAALFPIHCSIRHAHPSWQPVFSVIKMIPQGRGEPVGLSCPESRIFCKNTASKNKFHQY